MLTDEQIRVLLEMGDITEEERQQLQQQLMANQLRQQVFEQDRMDYGSQASRALSGLFSGMAHKKAGETGADITQMYRDTLRRLYPQNEPGGLQTPGYGGPLPQTRTMTPMAGTPPEPTTYDTGERSYADPTMGTAPSVTGPTPARQIQLGAIEDVGAIPAPTPLAAEQGAFPNDVFNEQYNKELLNDEQMLIDRLRKYGSRGY